MFEEVLNTSLGTDLIWIAGLSILENRMKNVENKAMLKYISQSKENRQS